MAEVSFQNVLDDYKWFLDCGQYRGGHETRGERYDAAELCGWNQGRFGYMERALSIWLPGQPFYWRFILYKILMVMLYILERRERTFSFFENVHTAKCRQVWASMQIHFYSIQFYFRSCTPTVLINYGWIICFIVTLFNYLILNALGHHN